MGLWTSMPVINQPPNTDDLGVLRDYVKDLANTVARMAKDLEFMVNGHLDAKNIRAESIEAENLAANSVTADKIQAGSISAEKIQAGAVTAEKISVRELSAISANLGHIVAGLIESVQIFGSYIATSYGYPRAEMSNTNNMFGAYREPGNSIQIYSPPGEYSPVIKFEARGIPNVIFYDPNDNRFSFSSSYADINISTQRDIQLYGENVRLAGWSKLRSNGTGRTLDDELTDIDRRLRNLGG